MIVVGVVILFPVVLRGLKNKGFYPREGRGCPAKEVSSSVPEASGEESRVYEGHSDEGRAPGRVPDDSLREVVTRPVTVGWTVECSSLRW